MTTDTEIWNDVHASTQWGTCPHPLVARWAMRRWGGESKNAFGRVRLLEVGCGMGTQARWLAEHGFQVDAMDASENVVARAREFNRPFHVYHNGAVTIRAGALPDDLAMVPEDYYDGTVDVCCLQHVDELEQSVREIARVVKPGGSLLSIFATHKHTSNVRPAVGTFWRIDMREVQRLFGKFFIDRIRIDHASYTDRDDLIDHWIIEATK